MPSSFFLTERSQRIVSENYRSKHIRKRRMWMRISRAWQRERGFIFFSVRLELSLGILQRRRYVSSVERLSCTLDPRCIKFSVLPRWISSTLSWLLFIQHLLLHIPKVKMAEMSRTICTRALWVCTHHFWHSIHLVWLIYWFNLSTVSSRR